MKVTTLFYSSIIIRESQILNTSWLFAYLKKKNVFHLRGKDVLSYQSDLEKNNTQIILFHYLYKNIKYNELIKIVKKNKIS